MKTSQLILDFTPTHLLLSQSKIWLDEGPKSNAWGRVSPFSHLLLVLSIGPDFLLYNSKSFFWQALDTFNTAVISPVYYVMFTTFTILASMIMFKVKQDLPLLAF